MPFGCWYDQNGGPQPLYRPWQGECIPKGSSHLLGLTKCVSVAPSQAPLLCGEGCTAPGMAGGCWYPCSPFFHSSAFWGDGGLQSPHICRQRPQTAHLGVPCAPYLLPIEGSCTLSAPWIGCSVSQHIHSPGCLEMLQQGWSGHPPKHPICPWPDPAYTRESWEQGRMWSSRLGWVSRALTVGRDELDPPGQVKVAAWVTSVTGNWRGDRGGQLQAALRRSSRAWGERVRGSWVSKIGRQEPWLGPSSASRAALCSAPSNKQAEGPPPRERGLLEVSGAAIQAFPWLSCYLSFSASPS